MTSTGDESLNPGDSAKRAMTARHELLFDAWFDGTITDDEFAELEAGLLESRDMRRRFWGRASVHGTLREAARIRFAELPVAEDRNALVAEVSPGPDLSPHGFSGSTLVSAARWLVPAATWLVAVLVTSTAVAFTHLWVTAYPALLTVHREGFETPPHPGREFQPEQFDVWGGDETEVVASEDGVAPHGGSRMLRFESNHPQNDPGAGAIGEIWRFINLDILRTASGGQLGQVRLSAFFNAARSGLTVKPYGGVSLIATDTPPRAFRHDWRQLFVSAESRPAFVATAESRQVLDGDRTSWQRVTASITPPTGARYLVLHCFTERWQADGERLFWEPMGFYVDDIRLDILPTPED